MLSAWIGMESESSAWNSRDDLVTGMHQLPSHRTCSERVGIFGSEEGKPYLERLIQSNESPRGDNDMVIVC